MYTAVEEERKMERRFLESGHLKTCEIYRTMTSWQMIMKVGFEDGTWGDLAQHLDQWRALLFEVLNLRLLSPKNH